MNIAWQRFHAAALLLARSGTVKERLQTAYRRHLADLDPDSLPPEIRGSFISLSRAMTLEKPMRGEDAVAATIRKLSSQEADSLATSLVEIFAHLSSLEDWDADSMQVTPATVNPTSAQVIPLFAEARS